MNRARLAALMRRAWRWRSDHPGRIAPFFCVTVGVLLGRAWHDNGAAHRIPFVVIGILLALILAAVGAFCATGENSETLAGTVLAVAAAVWLFAVTGYGDSKLVDTAIWFGAMVLAYVLASRHWRAERAARLAEQAEADRVRIIAQAQVDVAAVTASATVRAAELTSAATVHAAALTSGSLDPYAAAVLVAAWAGKAELGDNSPAAIVMTAAIPSVTAGPAQPRQLDNVTVPALAPAAEAGDFDDWAEQAITHTVPFPKQGVRR